MWIIGKQVSNKAFSQEGGENGVKQLQMLFCGTV